MSHEPGTKLKKATRTHCKAGHDISDEANVVVKRYCRQCAREQVTRYREKGRAPLHR